MVQKIKQRLMAQKMVCAKNGTQDVEAKEFRVTNPLGNALIRIVGKDTSATETVYFASNEGAGDSFAVEADGSGALNAYSKPSGGSFLVVSRLGAGKCFLPGDANQALALTNSSATSAIDGTICVYADPITADRTVTLSTTRAYAGMRYRIVRQAAATGAFAVLVGTGPLKSLDAGQWVDVHFDGTAWFVSAFGSL